MYDEAGLHRFGTTLPELDEDTVPSKKPIRLEDQIVTDENGKRRFHGAFTGGFSAGYWNTVGSQEGWTPATFKSSRSEKAANRLQQRPDDFMDDEDRGEFGIAPQRLQTRSEYTSFEPEESKKRKLMAPSSGSIPGKPVLEQLLAPRNIKIGERILKSMGWRPGQGIGPRQTLKEKKMTRSRNHREMYVMKQYGYQPKAPISESLGHSDDAGGEEESSDEELDKITFAPDDYEPYVCIAKKDRFGVNYQGGLSRDAVLSNAPAAATSNRHINLFEPALEAMGKNNKKISFKGQAFGVGALEEEDEDIYARDDMSRYDFSLDDHKPKKRKVINEQDQLIVEGFLASKIPLKITKPENPLVPESFIPRNWLERRSRFQPIDAKKAEELELYFKKVELSKNRLNPDERSELLGETQSMEENPTTSTCVRQEQAQKQTQPKIDFNPLQENKTVRGVGVEILPEKARLMLERLEQKNRFTRASDNMPDGSDDLKEVMKQVYDESKKSDTTSTMFKPFLHDEQKQRRYEEFLLAKVNTEEEITCFLNKIQPVHLSGWDREMEKKEFIQASKIFKPLDGLMSERFISEANIQAEHKPLEISQTCSFTPKKITVERSRSMWKPHPLLCKRYNIAEPYGGHIEEEKRPASSAKISVFDYLEDCVHKKSDFKTPVIVPVKIPRIQPILKQTSCKAESEPANSGKSITSVSTGYASTMATRNLSSSELSATSTVVEDQLKSKHASPRLQKVDSLKVGRTSAKTDLEKLAEESISKPPSEKLELYKAIFEDSSDEETVTSKEETNANNCPLKKENQSLPLSLSGDSVNVLRNTSPPRGIFSALLSTKGEQKTAEKTAHNSTESFDVGCDIDLEVSHGDIGHARPALIPASAESVKEHKIEFKQPTGSSSKISLNTYSTASSNPSDDEVFRKTSLKVGDPPFLNFTKAESSPPSNIDKGKLPKAKTRGDRLADGGRPYGPTAGSLDVPSTSSGLESAAYGPALPYHIQTPITSEPVYELNKVVEEKMLRFLGQQTRNSKNVRDEEWVEKKVRKILKNKTLPRSSSSSSVDKSSDEDNESRKEVMKKKSKKNKSHKKTKKKSKEKKSKKTKKNKDKY
ncbi:G patch domain-containing protein 1 homolog [Anastrepha obliqua]|uniref:G patch domain-containing protein 1 homolog n=1 Tax=Anastrepha obliqua TaxID=95512 RepID=UPI00240A8799|nr:G patch domain-containing protein 1 homolog [Anastrepha obliqua]